MTHYAYLKGPVLITGATGFIGAHLCRAFAGQAEVVALESPLQRGWRLNDVPSVGREVLDLTDAEAVRRLVRNLKPAYILNCAAYGAYPSDQDPQAIYGVNFHAVRFLLDAVAGEPWFHAFVQAGSSSEYGLRCAGPAETEVPLPDSHYAVSKVAATSLISFYGKAKSVPAWVLRLSSVYGPFEEISRLIPQALLAARARRLPALAHPEISRDFVYIDDIVLAFKRVLQKAGELAKGEVFNIGTGRKTTLAQLADCLREQFGIQSIPDWGSFPDRHWDHSEWFSNPAKARQQLQWEAGTSLAQGLQKTFQWMNENPHWIHLAEANSVLRNTK